jgi:eukaryotic-like serine/threonine-protein kinase
LNDNHWPRLFELFDELGECSLEQRRLRLTELAATEPDLAKRLRRMLDADALTSGPLDYGLDEIVPELIEQAGQAAWETVPGSRIGPFELVAPLGEGGMGEVWRAERADGNYRQAVALKLLKRGLDTRNILRRFVQERAILARLNHPCIVRLIDGGMSESGRPWFAMEHVVGAPITSWANDRQLGLKARVELLIRICDAVSHAHGQLVIHRDLKPANILVDTDGRPRLLDFGIAKLLEDSSDSDLTRTGVRLLSPAYAAPEQIAGEPVSVATDVYALGLVLFELLAGQLPTDRNTDGASVVPQSPRTLSRLLANSDPDLVKARFGPSSDARRLARRVRGDLDQILAMALRPEPDRRYPSVSAFAADLRAWLAGWPVTARPDSALYRSRRFVRRHALGVSAVAAVMLALATGLGLALWQADIAREQAARATAQALRADQTRDFIVSAFTSINPTISRDGVRLTLAEFLETTVDRLDSALSDAPDARVDLRMELAGAMQELGLLPAAGVSLRKALDELRGLNIEHDLAREVRLLHLLAMNEQRNGSLEMAVAYVDESLRIAAELPELPETLHLQRISARTTLAYLATDLGQYDEALAQYLSIREDRLALNGREDHRMAVDWLNLCATRYYLADYVLAEADCRHADALLQSDPDAPRVRRAWVGNSLAMVLTATGRYEEADSVLAESVGLVREYLGEPHPMLATLITNQVSLRLADGRAIEVPVLMEEIERQQPLESLNASRARIRLSHIGRAELALGRLTSAESFLRQSLELATEAGLDFTHQSLRTRRVLADVLVLQGQIEEALLLADSVTAQYLEMGWDRHDEYAHALLTASRAHGAAGQPDQARALESQALSLLATVVGDAHPLVIAGSTRQHL